MLLLLLLLNYHFYGLEIFLSIILIFTSDRLCNYFLDFPWLIDFVSLVMAMLKSKCTPYIFQESNKKRQFLLWFGSPFYSVDHIERVIPYAPFIHSTWLFPLRSEWGVQLFEGVETRIPCGGPYKMCRGSSWTYINSVLEFLYPRRFDRFVFILCTSFYFLGSSFHFRFQYMLNLYLCSLLFRFFETQRLLGYMWWD